MIIIGYPGVGKTSLAGRYNQYIDLESSHFNDAFGEKPSGWFIPYCKVAEDLSRQGYRVFVSCHKEVQEYFSKSNEYALVLYPAIELKEQWLDRVKRRFNNDPSMKNKKAMENVEKYWDVHINSLRNSPFENKLVLGDMNYALDNEIDNYILKKYL
jgi:nucleoside-triphosphatase THEP1